MIDFSKLPDRPWNSRKVYRKFSAQLAVEQDADFQRAVLCLLHVVWPSAVVAPKLGWIDSSGSDILVWSDENPFPLVAQCKGFKVPEERVGKVQIQQLNQNYGRWWRPDRLRLLNFGTAKR